MVCWASVCPLVMTGLLRIRFPAVRPGLRGSLVQRIVAISTASAPKITAAMTPVMFKPLVKGSLAVSSNSATCAGGRCWLAGRSPPGWQCPCWGVLLKRVECEEDGGERTIAEQPQAQQRGVEREGDVRTKPTPTAAPTTIDRTRSGSTTGPACSRSSMTGTAIKNTEPRQKCCCNRNPPRTGPCAPHPATWQVARTVMA